jgi:hypothetical protein
METKRVVLSEEEIKSIYQKKKEYYLSNGWIVYQEDKSKFKILMRNNYKGIYDGFAINQFGEELNKNGRRVRDKNGKDIPFSIADYKDRIIIFSVVAGIILLLVVFGSLIDQNKTNQENDNSTQQEKKTYSNDYSDLLSAYGFAEDYVKQNVKTPSRAEFPGSSEKIKHTTYLGGNVYYIVSWVDSENSFGAMIRTKFSCKITFKDENVSMSELKFNE